MKNIILLLLFLGLYTPSLFSQTYSDDDDWYIDMNEELKAWENKRPAISINFGISNLSHKDLEAAFADNNQIGLKLGYTYQRTKYADNIEKSTFNYLLINHNSTELAGGSDAASDIETNNWQYGIAFSNGFGYKVGTEAVITPYYSSSISLTDVKYLNDSLSANDKYIMDRYEGSSRFGSSSEFGVRGQITDLLTIEAGYEIGAVFERWLFWKWAGSSIIESAANNVLDIFIKEIFKSSPSAGPIAFIVLKGALGYGLYELRKEKMNWPFPSASPILFNNVKIGLTFNL